MKTKLTWRETIYITSMLFGMFFGAGNLIFPVYMGQLAGGHVWPAIAGFLVTGVGLPLLGVAALGISRSDGLASLSAKVGKGYGYFFTCLLYLTIGPFFAIPRCATVPFSVGMTPLLGEGADEQLWLAVFTLVFFALVLFFSLRPGKILTWIGKILNPVFLVVLAVLVVTALLFPMGSVSSVAASGDYIDKAFFTGFLEGYNTMDALAGLAFGIVVVNVIRDLKVTEPSAVAGNTVRAGVFSCLLMGLIYLATTIVGVQSRAVYPQAANGGEVLGMVAQHYFGSVGAIILAVIVTFACLKTAVGLITSCSETFRNMFPKGPAYPVWATIFSVVSFLIANLGLNAIIAYSLPVLMFLYPLAITLILLALFGRFFKHARCVYAWTTGFTLVAALFDFFKALPEMAQKLLRLDAVVEVVGRYLPFSDLGLGWICPSLIGLIIGLAIYLIGSRKETVAEA